MADGGTDERPDGRGATDEFAKLVVERLATRRAAFARYRVGEECGRGATGQVLRAFDEDLRREVAMKVLSARGAEANPSPRESLRVGRFLDEAQVTGQLDHPGIVPVHELGLDTEGRLYFTMRLVRGLDLKEVLELARTGRDGWTTVRVVGVLLKVCEAMAYAHHKRVVHRDLKPGNVRVGRFGEVFVMDWGLARLLDAPDRRDIRIREPNPATIDVASERRDHSDSDAASHLVTMDGDVVGTPVYMPPEQARGEIDRVGPHSDVYSVGAMLYHLLAGHMPYVPAFARLGSMTVLRFVKEGPPEPLTSIAPEADRELVAICAKAMQREPERRYASMLELADDLRAWLEGRVVRAHGASVGVALKKWVRRNRAVAAMSAALALVLAFAGSTVVAKEMALAAEERRNVDTLAARHLLDRAEDVAPIAPESAAAFAAWEDEVRTLLGRKARYVEERDRFAERAVADGRATRASATAPAESAYAQRNALAWAETFERRLLEKTAAAAAAGASEALREEAREAAAILPAEIEFWRARAAELAPRADSSGTLAFRDPSEERRYEALCELADALDELERRALPAVRARAALARDLYRRSVGERESARLWDEARRSIADEKECPRYGGLALEPQTGLVPLARNPRTGLWEFWHVLSGERPEPDGTGGWIVGPATGMVLVLIPGGSTVLGAQSSDAAAPNFDRRAGATETPMPIALDPYFLSKYEMTQGQWLAVRGDLPSEWFAGRDIDLDPRISRSHPVEHVSHAEARAALTRIGLDLPTEAQWEHGARGGSDLAYVYGAEPAAVRRGANHADARFALQFTPGRTAADLATLERELDDGRVLHAPVGSYAPNGFGLHDALGNVAEWCRDWYGDSEAEYEVRPGDGERVPRRSSTKVFRGGGFRRPLDELRAAARLHRRPTERDDDLGLRAARAIQPRSDPR